jgi:N-acetyl-anhydromuramyl-L-alanine amidase AmpD/CubicO group peptidase (beta-lactamase class C family)
MINLYLKNTTNLFAILAAFLICSCSSLNIKNINSENHNERIRFLILHYTTIDYQSSINVLTKKNGVSANYLIPQSGDKTYPNDNIKVVQLVDEEKRAWYAGKSYWQGLTNLNDQSIGIELVYQAPCVKQDENVHNPNNYNLQANPNFNCTYPYFHPKKIKQLTNLIKKILKRNPEITPENIIGHTDIASNRRIDPGLKLPWESLYKQGVGAWYDDETVKKYKALFSLQEPSINLIQAALKAYGYGLTETGQLDSETINTLTVFQMHFLQNQVNGKITANTVATLFSLIEKYHSTHLENLIHRFNKESLPKALTEEVEYSGQFNGLYPKQNLSSRKLVNHRNIFKGYKGKGYLNLINNGASSVSLSINGQKINMNQHLKSQFKTKINISQFTKDGYNTIKVENVLPKESSIIIEIPFPKLTEFKDKTTGFSTTKLKQIDALIKQEVKQGFPGATLLIAKQGKIIKKTAYGYSNRYSESGIPLKNMEKMTTGTLFDLASNTKMFATNYAIMKLASEKKLDLNLPLQNYLPEYQYGNRETRLVKDLLTHSAGYPPVVNFHDKKNHLNVSFFSQNKIKTQQLLIEKVPFEIGRNIKNIYSDVDYMLLGTLIERITHMPLDEYVEKEIYKPLGLSKTVFNPLTKGFTKKDIAATELQGNTRQSTIEFEDVRRNVIQGEVHDEKAFHAMQGVSGHAGLFSTAKETAILASVILNRGGYGDVKLFDKSQLDQFLKPSHLDITMGLGWRRAGNGERAWQFGPYASPYAIGHTGWTGTVTIIDPYYDLIIVLLTNKKHSQIIETKEGKKFAGDTFETGQYGSIISLVYEAFLDK